MVSAPNSPPAQRVETRYVMYGVVVVGAVLVLQAVGGWMREVVSDEPTHLELVQTCLKERSRPFEPVIDDPIAATAGRGALSTVVDGNRLTIALGSSERDAERVFGTYVAVVPDDVVQTRLERRRKVVFLWGAPPTAAQRNFAYLCTLDAQN
jgi:hypothetical protein